MSANINDNPGPSASPSAGDKTASSKKWTSMDRYINAIKQKQNGTLPRFEEELWRHCCSFYHKNVPLCDLCQPRSEAQRAAIKEEIKQTIQRQNQQERKRKVDDNDHLNPNDIKKKKNSERKAAYRQTLTFEAKDKIRQREREQYAIKMQSLTSEEKDKVKQRNTEQHALRRHSLSTEERDGIRQRDRDTYALKAQSLTPQEKDEIKQKGKKRHALRKVKARKLTAKTAEVSVGQYFNENDMEPHDAGPMTFTCSECNALMFEKELHRGTTYSLCCGYGKVKVPPIKPPPPILQQLLTENSETSKNFRSNIRCYNSALALSSIGVELGTTFKFDYRGPWIYKISGQVYHSLGTIFPNCNSSPVFSQLYVYDREHELANRQKRNPDRMDEKTLQELQDMMHAHNPYVKEYIKAADMVQQNPSQDIQLVLKATGTPDPRRYNLPTGNDLAIVIPQVATNKPTYRDVVLYKTANDHPQGYTTVRINEMHPMYDPTAYPLLFVFGDKGYDYQAFKSKPSDSEDQSQVSDNTLNVTTRKYYRYHFMERADTFNTLHQSGRLMQQYVTDMWSKIEKEQLDYQRRRQDDLRTEVLQSLTDAMATDTSDNIGTKVILPADYTGSPRQMHGLYQDSMALVRHFGKPELFITFTCNPKWPEITCILKEDQSSSDRQDVVNRVFYLKLKEFQVDMFNRDLLGNVKAYCWTLEEQKRSLKHVHLLTILQQHITPEWIDKVVWAVIPDESKMPKLHKIVTTCMIHGPCGEFNPNAPCMINGKCKSGYPKPYREYTSLSEDGFALYARPNDGVTFDKNGFLADNRWVVPYNPVLLLKYNAHINVEVCVSVKNIKYIYKYVHKGADMASVGAQQADCKDEIKDFVSSRWITPSTATWNTFEFPNQKRHPAVERLAIHEENQQKVTFRVGEEGKALEKNQDTTLTAWMKFNKDNPEARNIKYPDFPQHYRWDKGKKRWMKRKQAGTFSIGRVYTTNPAQGERHYLRMILYHVPGAVNWADLRTVNGQQCDTYKEACVALGILNDDAEHEKCLDESAQRDMPPQLRSLFCTILVYCEPLDPKRLWMKFKESMSDDVAHMLQKNDVQTFTDSQIENEVLKQIETELHYMGKSLKDFPGMPPLKMEESINVEPPIIQDELFNVADQKAKLEATQTLLNHEQQIIFNEVVSAVCDENPTHQVFMVNSPGGFGKTFLFATILSATRAKAKISLAVSPTGLAAENMEGGRTAHSRFRIPIPISTESMCDISAQSNLAKLLQRAELITWDEVFATHRLILECVDRTMQDLRKSKLPFGGCVTVLGGDPMQILPIVPHGSEAEIMDSCVKNSPVWKYVKEMELTTNMRVNPEEKEFCDFLIKIGKGEHEKVDPLQPHLMSIPSQYLLQDLDSLINAVFPDLAKGYEDEYFLANRTILTPLNENVDKINALCVNMFPGDNHTYLSADTLHKDSCNLNIPTEYLNSITPSGCPPHSLQLKQNTVVMLLKNLRHGKTRSLRNGTRLLVKRLASKMLECEIVTGVSKGSTVFLPRIPMHVQDSELPFNMTRLQFPVRPCFSMTINKAQGQSMDTIGIFLPEPVFAHGQLYVALSRVRTHKMLYVCLGEDENSKKGITHNIVYHSII